MVMFLSPTPQKRTIFSHGDEGRKGERPGEAAWYSRASPVEAWRLAAGPPLACVKYNATIVFVPRRGGGRLENRRRGCF